MVVIVVVIVGGGWITVWDGIRAGTTRKTSTSTHTHTHDQGHRSRPEWTMIGIRTIRRFAGREFKTEGIRCNR